MSHDSGLRSGGTAALTARLEEVPGVAAAAVQLDELGIARSIRIAALDTPPLEQIRSGVQEVLLSLGVRAEPDALRIGVLTVPPIPNGVASSSFDPPADSSDPVPPRSAEPHHGAAAPQPIPDGTLHERNDRSAAFSRDTAGQPSGSGPSPSPVGNVDAAPWHGRFLLLDDLDVHLDRTHCRCRVDLIRLTDRFDGEATDLATEIGRARAAARASLAAARKAAPGVTLALEGVQIVPLFGRRYIALTVEAAAERRFQSLSALVVIDHSIEHAAALAALRAVERWIAW